MERRITAWLSVHCSKATAAARPLCTPSQESAPAGRYHSNENKRFSPVCVCLSLSLRRRVLVVKRLLVVISIFLSRNGYSVIRIVRSCCIYSRENSGLPIGTVSHWRWWRETQLLPLPFSFQRDRVWSIIRWRVPASELPVRRPECPPVLCAPKPGAL